MLDSIREAINKAFITTPAPVSDVELIQIRKGSSPALICIDGFLCEGDDTSREWLSNIPSQYSKRAIYALKWESKNLIDFATAVNSIGAMGIAVRPGLFGVANVIMDARKPWVNARNNTPVVGVWLANYIQKSERKFVIIGHSLGARVAYYCLDHLSKIKCYGQIKDVHLLGGSVDNHACSSKQKQINWYGLDKVVTGNIRNYHSDEDSILKFLFNLLEGFTEDPIGRHPIDNGCVINHNVTSQVSGHTEFKAQLAKYIA